MDHYHDETGKMIPIGESDETSAETVEAIADASVEIAEIEAETERGRIESDAEIAARTIEAGLEHHRIDAESVVDELAETVEEFEEIAETLDEALEEAAELEEALEEAAELDGDDESDDSGESDELEESGDAEESDAIGVVPPPRVEDDTAKAKASRRSSFTARHTRRR